MDDYFLFGFVFIYKKNNQTQIFKNRLSFYIKIIIINLYYLGHVDQSATAQPFIIVRATKTPTQFRLNSNGLHPALFFSLAPCTFFLVLTRGTARIIHAHNILHN
jgi:hypothetical protein